MTKLVSACILCCLFMLKNLDVCAQQKQTSHISQLWLAYFNQTRLSDKWGVWLDLHLRTKEDVFSNLSQSIVRTGVTYYVNDHTKLTAGYAYVNHFPGDNHTGISQPEHRLWQQLQWHTNYKNLRLMQWFRLDERWRRKIKNNTELAEGNDFNYRLRYNFFAQAPLGKKRFAPGSLSAVLNNEIHINFGKSIINNYFDQNRFFLGFNYQVSKTGNLQFGYMNVFQQLPAGYKYKSVNAGRVFYFHSLDLRKKSKKV